MKNLILLACLLCSTSLFAQQFWLGYATQAWGVSDPSLGLESNGYWENSYRIHSPVKIFGKLEFGSGLFAEAGLGHRTEILFRRTTGPFEHINFPDNAFTSNSYKRTFYLLDLSSTVGYIYQIKRFGLSGDLGTSFSKVYFMRTQNIDYPKWAQEVKYKSWINQKDFMVDLQVGLGLSYLLGKKTQVQVKLIGRRRLYTTTHFNLKGRAYNSHPSHDQKYLLGSEFSIAHNMWN
jgi:hypothetical protein